MENEEIMKRVEKLKSELLKYLSEEDVKTIIKAELGI